MAVFIVVIILRRLIKLKSCLIGIRVVSSCHLLLRVKFCLLARIHYCHARRWLLLLPLHSCWVHSRLAWNLLLRVLSIGVILGLVLAHLLVVLAIHHLLVRHCDRRLLLRTLVI